MPFQPKHIGLYFSAEHIQPAQSAHESPHIAEALRYLNKPRDTNPLIQAQLAGLRYRFLSDDNSGLQAVNMLKQLDTSASDLPYLETVKSLLAWLSVIEMVRSHDAWANSQEDWFDMLRKQLTILNQPPDTATLLDVFWLGALHIGAGIVLDDESLFLRGEETYRLAVGKHIHPEGFIKGLVDVQDATDTFRLQVSGTCALVLMAEMAQHAGVDLWSVDNRGITPITAATYVHYYVYYPEKWKWEADLTTDITTAIMTTKGAFIEIVNRRSPIRGVEILLDDYRPLFAIYGGGLTTLTHGIPAPQKKKRWRLFGS